MAFYGPKKVAREIFFRNLAEKKRAGDKILQILNYALGPVDTNMLSFIAERTISHEMR